MAEHFHRHAAEFWPGITVKEYTAIGKEVIDSIDNVKVIVYERKYRGKTRLMIHDIERDIFVFTNEAKDKIYSIFKAGKKYLERMRKTSKLIEP